jgi:PTS system mannose-specific IIC component
MNGAMAIPTFLGVYFGAEPVANLVDVIPAAIMNGFNAVAGLLPAVGMALLVRMLWNSKTAIYFLLGFICVSYLGMPMVGVAALAAVIVVVEAFRQLDMLDLKKKLQALREGGGAAKAETQAQIEEEDFFA